MTTAADPQPGADTAGCDALLDVSGLEVSFYDETGRRPVLHNVALSIDRGERVAVVGESGSGKSTTAAAVLQLLPGNGAITAGRIDFAGEDLATADEATMRRLRGRHIGLVPQDPMSNLNPVARVGTQITETLLAHRLATRAQAQRHTIELLSEAGIADAAQRVRQYPHEFSGGMRQRVLIAIALACQPDLLIADEPTSALDVTVQQRILNHLEDLCASRGASLLLITHDLGLAADRADRVLVMSNGRVRETGPSQDVLRSPQDSYTRQLIQAVPSLSATHTTGQRRDDDNGNRTQPGDDEAAQQSTAASNTVQPSQTPDRDRTDSPIIEADNLVKQYRVRGRRGEPLTAVDHVSFTTAPATTTAIVGESGSGKTTVARMVLGLESPTAGTVAVTGKGVVTADRAQQRAIRRAMQPVFQDPYASLNPTFSIERVIDEPLRIFNVGDRRKRRVRVAELLDQVALPGDVAHRHPGELSGGQRQRVAIARALALQPSLVVCDEAVSALDVLVQDQILKLLADLKQDLGLSYLFITHDLAVVRLVADEILVMQSGSVVESGPMHQVFDQPNSDYTKALLAAIPGTGLFADAIPHRGEVEPN